MLNAIVSLSLSKAGYMGSRSQINITAFDKLRLTA
jgi:hypothetical protein